MDFFHSPISSKHQFQRNKKRLSQEQVKLLERSFSSNSKLEPERKLLLAKQLGIPPRQVAIWYQNKRARWKTQSLELDYNAIQMKLEAAVAEKRRLEKDVDRLKMELKNAHELLMALNNHQTLVPADNHETHRHNNHNHNHNHSCGEECAASSSMQQQDHHHQDVNFHEVKQLEELYACLIGMQ